MVYNDLTFFTNEPERDLYSRFNNILRKDEIYKRELAGKDVDQQKNPIPPPIPPNLKPRSTAWYMNFMG